MSSSGPFEGGADGFGPFSEMLGQFLGAMQSSPASRWDQAKQLAAAIATQGDAVVNVDPSDRIAFEQLQRVAELQVADVTGLQPAARVTLVNRTQWTSDTVDAYRPMFEELSGSFDTMLRSQLGEIDSSDLAEMGEAGILPPGFDPAFLLDALSKMVGPLMLSMMVGSTVGQLGTRAFGSYDLPIPRLDPAHVVVVADSLDSFATDWELPRDDLRLWAIVHELTSHAVLTTPHLSARMTELLAEHARHFSGDLSALESQLGDIDPTSPDGLARLQSALGDPSLVLGAMSSPHQDDLRAQLDTLVSTVGGYVDWVVDTVAQRLLGEPDRVSEAMRRRRVETDQASRFVERLFGLELTQDTFDRGAQFVTGIRERSGAQALPRLWSSAEGLPTTAELASPALWLARQDIDQDTLPEVDVEVPDFPDFEN